MTRRSGVSAARKAIYAKAKVQLETRKALEEMEAAREIPEPTTQSDLERLAKAKLKRQRKAQIRSAQCEKTAQSK